MAKPTFMMALRKNEIRVTSYAPMIYTRGHEAWRLALHRENGKGSEWIVSDPVSGYRVCRLTATYKGMPVSSCTLTEKQARACALVDLDLLVDRIGLERFSTVLNTSQNPKVTA